MLAHVCDAGAALKNHWVDVWCLPECLGPFIKACCPANTRTWPNDVSMLDQRRRRWANIETTLGQVLVLGVLMNPPTSQTSGLRRVEIGPTPVISGSGRKDREMRPPPSAASWWPSTSYRVLPPSHPPIPPPPPLTQKPLTLSLPAPHPLPRDHAPPSSGYQVTQDIFGSISRCTSGYLPHCQLRAYHCYHQHHLLLSKMLSQCWFNVGPASATLAQH